ncbi:MAG: extracellular solute-binding protein, partial [Deltaproteobacteria bacterium]
LESLRGEFDAEREALVERSRADAEARAKLEAMGEERARLVAEIEAERAVLQSERAEFREHAHTLRNELQRELMAAAMRYLGYSAQEKDAVKWEQAKQVILRAKPYWATFSNSTYIKDLAIGNIWVAHGYSNDMYRAREDAKAARRPFSIGFTTPKEGAVLAVDNFVLHTSGQRPDLAHRFIDFMLEGENAADVSNLIGAGNANAAATPFIRPEIAAEEGIFPPPQTLGRLEMLRDFEPKMRRALSRMWTEIRVR